MHWNIFNLPDRVNIDGIFGSETQIAVEGFQESIGLKVDGIVGRQTWRELGN